MNTVMGRTTSLPMIQSSVHLRPVVHLYMTEHDGEAVETDSVTDLTETVA